MTRRKRRSTARTAAVNPRRRRRSVVVRSNRGRAALTLNPRRRRNRRAVANPHRRRNRQRNPSAKGILMGGIWAGAGAAATNLVAGFLPLGGGGWMDVVKQLAAAYIVGFVAERVPFIGHANAQLMAIGGFAGTAWSAVNMALTGATGFLQGGGHAQAVAASQPGVSDIVPAPSFYPGMHGLDDVVPAPSFYPTTGVGY